MSLISKIGYQDAKPKTYRNLRIWVHMVFVSVSGFVNLFYGGIVPIVTKAMNSLNENGTAAFFEGASWDTSIVLLLTGAPHLAFAICSLVVGLASLDALKERLMDAGAAN